MGTNVLVFGKGVENELFMNVFNLQLRIKIFGDLNLDHSHIDNKYIKTFVLIY